MAFEPLITILTIENLKSWQSVTLDSIRNYCDVLYPVCIGRICLRGLSTLKWNLWKYHITQLSSKDFLTRIFLQYRFSVSTLPPTSHEGFNGALLSSHLSHKSHIFRTWATFIALEPHLQLGDFGCKRIKLILTFMVCLGTYFWLIWSKILLLIKIRILYVRFKVVKKSLAKLSQIAPGCTSQSQHLKFDQISYFMSREIAKYPRY